MLRWYVRSIYFVEVISIDLNLYAVRKRTYSLVLSTANVCLPRHRRCTALLQAGSLSTTKRATVVLAQVIISVCPVVGTQPCFKPARGVSLISRWLTVCPVFALPPNQKIYTVRQVLLAL